MTTQGNDGQGSDSILTETSYQFRSYLNAILGYSEIIAEDRPGGDDLADLARRISDAGEAVVEVVQVLERVVAQEKARRRMADLLRHMSTLMTASLEIDDVVEVIHTCVAEVIEPDASFVLLTGISGLEVMSQQVHGDVGAGAIIGSPGLERLVSARETQAWADATGTVLAVPMIWGDELLGAIATHVPGAPMFLESDVDTIESLATHAALAVANAHKFGQTKTLADMDALTETYTRRRFQELAEEAIARAKREEKGLSLVMFDLDHFKEINDTYGHAAGDIVIREVVNRVKNMVRDSDILGRYGGEEFLLVLWGLADEDAVEVSERICMKIANDPVHLETASIDVTLSMGVATLSAEGELATLIERADEALYAAKEGGRNRVVAAG